MKKFLKNNEDNIIIFLIPCVIFFIILLAFFPGIISYDSNNQWQQVQSGLINDAHPFFTTYFMLFLSKIWNNIAIMPIFQILFFSFSWSYFCKNIREYNRDNRKKFKIQIIITILIALLPIVSLYSITIWKDILYSYYLMLIIFLIYKGIKNKFIYNKYDYCYLGFLLSMVFQYRHNGKIVAVLFLLFLFIFVFKKKISFKSYLIIFIVFLGLNLIISIPKKIYLEEYNRYIISKEEKKEDFNSNIDGYIIWIYGAYLKDDAIKSKKVLNELDKVIPLEKWKKAYDPFLMNDIGKCEKNVKYYNEHQDYFRKTFVKLSLKHPMLFIKHYLKADAMLWCPLDVGYIYSYDFTDWWPKYEFNNAKVYEYEEISLKLPIIKKITEKFTSFGLYFPMRLFYRPVNAIIVSVILLGLLIKQNKKKIYWMLLLPAIFNTVSLLPINLAQDLRYVYINYLTMIVILMLFFCEYNFGNLLNKFKKYKNNK